MKTTTTDDPKKKEGIGMMPAVGGILLFVGVLLVPFILRATESFVILDTKQGDIYRTLNAPLSPVMVVFIGLMCGYFGGLLISYRSRFATTCFAAAVATAFNTFVQPLPGWDAFGKLNIFSGVCGQRGIPIFATPGFFVVTFLIVGIVCFVNRPVMVRNEKV